VKTNHRKLRIEQLEDRCCPAAVATPLHVTAGGVKWTNIRNSNTGPGTFGNGFAITDGGVLAAAERSDAYDGAFMLRVNGTTFQNPGGMVDLTGTTVTTNAATLAGLNTTVQYFFDAASPTARALFSFTNPTGAAISATVLIGTNLGSDNQSFIRATSDGSTTVDAAAGWFVSSDANPNTGDPVNTIVRFGPGAILVAPTQIQIPGTPAPPSSNDNLVDQYAITVPAGQTVRLMEFGQVHPDIASATTAAATFNTTGAIANAGLTAGLSQQQLGEIVNWRFDSTPPAVISVNAPNVSNPTSYTFTVTYADDSAVDISSLGSSNILVTGPNSFSQSATFVSVDVNSNGTPRTATYSITPPGGAWDSADDGTYTLAVQSNQVRDPSGNAVAPGTIGTFTVSHSGGSLFATGADAGGGPHVKVYNSDGSFRFGFYAYDVGFAGGVRVAVADIDGDGTPDIITAVGAGGGPHVKVFSGADGHLLASFFAYAPGFNGGVYVAAADVNGDGHPDIISGAGAGGGPHVKVIDGTKLGLVQANGQISDGALLQSFFAYGAGFTGGVRVAAASGEGSAVVVTGPGAGGGPHVRVFAAGNPNAVLYNFMAFDPSYAGGVFVAAGDLDGDGKPDVIVSQGQGFGAHVRTFSGATGGLTGDFVPFASAGLSGPNGVRVAVANLDADARPVVLTGSGPRSPSRVRSYDGTTLAFVNETDPYDPSFMGGVFVG
jgi:hypothetical protein